VKDYKQAETHTADGGADLHGARGLAAAAGAAAACRYGAGARVAPPSPPSQPLRVRLMPLGCARACAGLRACVRKGFALVYSQNGCPPDSCGQTELAAHQIRGLDAYYP
jgi:hypothetical protein